MSIGVSYVICDGFYYFMVQAPYQFPGMNILLSMGIAGIMLGLIAIAELFLTVAMPRAGGEYIQISRVIHPVIGYFTAWQVWQGNTFVTAVVACTTTVFFGQMFYVIGTITGSSWWIDLGKSLSVPLSNPTFYIGFALLILVIIWILLLMGMKYYKWLINILFILPLAGGIVTLATDVYLVYAGIDAIKRGWDATFGAGAWDEIVTVATQNGWADYIAKAAGSGIWGWPGPWSMDATMASLVSSGYAWWGIGMANYVAGEVKEPSKSFGIGIPAAIVIIGAYYLIGAALIFLAYGPFISMYDYVVMGGYVDKLKINPGLTPTFSLFTYGPVQSSNPLIAIIVSFSAALWILNDIPIFPLVSSRIMFAMAFDRMLPERFATVNRFGSPTWSINVVMILTILGVFLTWWSPWFLGMICFSGVFWRYFWVAWTCAIYPFTRPDLFERGYTWKIAGFPVASIIGIISVILASWLMFPTMMWVVSDWSYIWWNIFWWTFSIVLFVGFYAYNQKKGINVSELYQAIPPA
jgi:APA family basic amino acid/polyamine antiporter